MTNLTQLETRLLNELLATNEALTKRLHTMKTYIGSAVAEGWLGEDDPQLLSFKSTISIHEKSVQECQLFDVTKLELETRPQGTIGKLLGATSALGERLKEEIKSRTLLGDDIDDSFLSMKKKTETSEKYVEIHESIPRRKDLAETEMQADNVAEIDDELPRIDSQCSYMSSELSVEETSFPSQASVTREYEALQKEVDRICQGLFSSRVDELLKEILQELVSITRRFSVIINRYHAGELGKGFAELASARFQAAYRLIQRVSSLFRESMVLEKPLVMLFHQSEFARSPDILANNIRLLNMSSSQRQMTRRINDQNLKKVTAMCFRFRDRNQEELQRLACTSSVEEPGDAVAPLKLNDDVIAMLEQDVDDIDFLQKHHKVTCLRTIPSGPVVEADEIVPTLKRFGLHEMQLPYNDSEQIGFGSFASIREVPYGHSNLWLAIKCYKIIPNEQSSMKRIVREAQIMSDLQHRNILSVFGYAQLPTQSNEQNDSDLNFITYALVYPAYKHGSLNNYLNLKSSKSLSELAKAKILRDIAAGLKYLHEPGKQVGVVVHGDVRAANVLITPTLRALLCDFGTSIHSKIEDRYQTRSVYSNPAWLAYESFSLVPSGEEVVPKAPTVKTDIYAFGCVCYELLLRKKPYFDCEADVLQILARKSHEVAPRLDIQWPSQYRARDQLEQLMKMCWRAAPARRPAASILVSILKGLEDGLS